jgi:selenocysteine lyase/cysteine desulfurase
MTDHRYLFQNLDAVLPVFGGEPRRYVNLDNAASTPALLAVEEAVKSFMPFYSSVHRGTGFKSQLSTLAYEQARSRVLQFVGAKAEEFTCIFTKNTTEAINKLARRFPFSRERDMVLTTGMEHHSNDLPWRKAAPTIHAGLTPEGRLDVPGFDRLLDRFAARIALVAVTGASNVTGYLNDIESLAEKAHAAGAQILVDAAQLAPHRKVEMKSLDDPTHLDYLTMSAHKLYAPFGSGALLGRLDSFEQGDPDMTGGGTVEIVTLDSVVWAGPPERDEAGSPNTVGAVAFGAALQQLQAVGMEEVARHEASLTAYALERLRAVPGLRLYGDTDPGRASERLGVLPFQVEGISHFKVSAVLGYGFGIGVRSGCFCAHPYILHLLGLSPEEARQVRERMLAGDKSEMPGLVRASFGLYNTTADVDALVDALECIVRGEYQGRYIQEKASGEYHLEGWNPYPPYLRSID